MGQPTAPKPVKLIVGMLAQREEWLAAAEEKMAERFGPIDLASDLFPFDFTDYYTPQMGAGLLRKFVTFQPLVQPDQLAQIKLTTNTMECELAGELDAPIVRPVNLDPGLLDGSRLILATTKDYVHRIYLADGIYAEITLTYRKGAWAATPWTYRDFREATYHPFLTKARARYLKELREDRR